MPNLLNPLDIIKTLGLFGVFLTIFAETGLFFGFFLPGDSLLFTAGFLSSQGHLNLAVLLVGAFAAAVIGDTVGYFFGAKAGPQIFRREDSFFFKKSYLFRTKEFYERHGKKTIVLARFLPIVRTFAPILAGVGNMEYPSFFFYNITGGLLWTLCLGLAGFALGDIIPDADRYLLPIVIAIIVVSFIPSALEFFRMRRKDSGKS